MPNEVAEVEMIAGEDVVFAEDFRPRAGFEPFLDVEVEWEVGFVEATGARREDRDVDRPAEIEPVSNPPDGECDGGRSLELVRLERWKAYGLADFELPAGGQDAPDIDRFRHFSRFPEPKTTLQ